MSNPVQTMRDLVTENFAVKVVALLITLWLSIWVRNDREATVVAHAAIRIEIPDNMVLVTQPIERVRLTVRGRSSDVNRFDPTEVPPLSVVASDEPDQMLTFTPDMVQLPQGLEVAQITPEFARVRLEPIARKKVPISPRLGGEPRADYVVGHVEVTPPTIELSGPASSIAKVQAVNTELVDITDRSQSIERRVQLRVDDPLIRYDAATTVMIKIPIDTAEVTRSINGVRLLAVNTTRLATIAPATLNVSLRGPKAAIDSLSPGELLATVDLEQEDHRGAGTYEKQPVVKNLPTGVTLVDYHPKNVIVSTIARPRESGDP
ncbi:MAG: CdaR family protein [bacterium]